MNDTLNGGSTPRFSEMADVDSSTDAYAARFKGAVGRWMLSVQERGARGLLADVTPGASILDVGGGHAQLAVPLGRDGYAVTVQGTDPSCAHRLREVLAEGRCRFVVGDMLALPFGDRSFDAVIAFRMLTHCTEWPRLAAELCRVTRGPVVVDYPTSEGVNAIAPMLFRAKKRLEGNTRRWRLFTHAEVDAAFAAAGFRRTGTYKQFFLPMVVHRMLRLRALAAGLEGICRGLGLTGRWGSPVIARYEAVSRG